MKAEYTVKLVINKKYLRKLFHSPSPHRLEARSHHEGNGRVLDDSGSDIYSLITMQRYLISSDTHGSTSCLLSSEIVDAELIMLSFVSKTKMLIAHRDQQGDTRGMSDRLIQKLVIN